MALGIATVRQNDLKIVIGIDVAGETRHIRVAVRQREACRVVIKSRPQPTVKRMARFAGGGKLGADMVRILGILKILQVAGRANRGKPLELSDCSAFVALLALHRGVSSQQRETILVILNLLDGDIPAEHRVTPRAIRSHFPLVYIGMTVLTLLAGVGKHRLDVALRALHFFVHTPQWILRFVVIKFRHGADGAPSAGGVAVFAGNLQGPVRAARGFALRFRPRRYSWLPNEKKQPAHDLDDRSIHSHPVPSNSPRRGWDLKNLQLV